MSSQIDDFFLNFLAANLANFCKMLRQSSVKIIDKLFFNVDCQVP